MKSTIDLLFLMFSSIIFLCASYGIHIKLAEYLKPGAYGTYNVTMGILVCIEYFIVNFIPKAIQNLVAKFPNDIEHIKIFFIRRQIIVSFVFFVVFFISSDLIAGLLKDSNISVYIKIALFDIPVYAVYAFFLAFYYGLGLFRKASLFLALFSIAKFLVISLVISFNLSLWTVFIGNIFVSFLGLVVTFSCLPKNSDGRIKRVEYQMRPYLWLALFQLSAYAFLYSDLFMVKRLVMDNNEVGVYAVAFNISRIVVYIFAQISFFMYPVLSKALHNFDQKAVQYYMKIVDRFILWGLLPIGLFVSIFSKYIVAFWFPYEYYYAGYVLTLVVLGVALIVVFMIFADIISIINPKISLGLGLVLLVINVLLCNIFIKDYGIQGAAKAVFITGTFGSFLGIFICKRLLKRTFQRPENLIILKHEIQ